MLPPMEWIEKAIRISSVTDQSNEEMVRFLTPLLSESGLKIDEQEIVEDGTKFKNLIAFSHTPESPNLIAFNTHLDTVAPGDSRLWTKTKGDPFKATRVKDRIYGLGTADVKLDFLCKILAARQSQPWKNPFVLVGTFGEERGLIGAEHLLAKKKIRPRFALVGEPSELELVFAHKGHLICTVSLPADEKAKSSMDRRWKGKAAHSSTPDLGINALEKGLTEIYKRQLGVCEIIAGTNSNKIPELCDIRFSSQPNEATRKITLFLEEVKELRSVFKKRRDTRFSPAINTLSINLARTIGNEIHLTFDVRILPEMDGERIKAQVEGIAKKAGLKIVMMSLDVPLKGNKNSHLMQMTGAALKRCGVKVAKKTKASSTEAAIYQHYGAEAIVFGPGRSQGNVHRPNEFNSLSQLEIATRVYTHLLTADWKSS